MLKILSLAALVALSGPTAMAAQDAPELQIIEAEPGMSLDEFHWQARPLVIFADSPFDPNFVEQMALIEEEADLLFERDVVVITDTDPTAMTAIRQELRPRGFMFVLIGKDGQKYLRKPFPWSVRELSRSIDKMPIRLQENDKSRLAR